MSSSRSPSLPWRLPRPCSRRLAIAVAIKDAALRGCIETALEKSAGETITEGELAGLSELRCFLRQLDRAYPKRALIRVILDNHSAHVSKETRAYLATIPNRFEFVFTPKHGSWLNLVESFFGKLGADAAARHPWTRRTNSRSASCNTSTGSTPSAVVFKWGYGLDDLEAA